MENLLNASKVGNPFWLCFVIFFWSHINTIEVDTCEKTAVRRTKAHALLNHSKL